MGLLSWPLLMGMRMLLSGFINTFRLGHQRLATLFLLIIYCSVWLSTVLSLTVLSLVLQEDTEGNTPILAAAAHGHLAVVSFLHAEGHALDVCCCHFLSCEFLFFLCFFFCSFLFPFFFLFFSSQVTPKNILFVSV